MSWKYRGKEDCTGLLRGYLKGRPRVLRGYLKGRPRGLAGNAL